MFLALLPPVLLGVVLFGPPGKPLLPPSAPPAVAKSAPPLGRWYARLVPSPDHPVEFEILVEKKGGALAATLVNDTAKTPFTTAAWDGLKLTLELSHYDARITAERRDGALAGMYTRTTASGLAEVSFFATLAPPSLRQAASSASNATLASIEGTWAFEIAEGPIPTKATGVFRQKGVEAAGTLLTTTGDYGALHGTFDGERLVLCVFDGVHVYRFDGELLQGDTMAGEFRSRANPPAGWRAKRLEAAAAAANLPGGFSIVRPKDPAAPYVLSFPGPDGKLVSSFDARFAGKPMLVTFMGTWCPNCADEAPVLRDLYARYRARGLEVVSLCFEYTDDIERNRRQVKRFIERFRIEHPVLIAGTTQETPTSPATAPLAGWEGYPTTLFLDKEHRIAKIHSGFDGPATGERFRKLKKEMEDEVRKLLDLEANGLTVPDSTSLGLR
jgi:thiol-disulfide isomerase/thioredoxin